MGPHCEGRGQVSEIDLTALDALERLRATLTERGIVFAMARVKMEIRDQLNVGGFIDRVGANRVFPTLPTAVAGFTAWCEAGRDDAEGGSDDAGD